MPDGQRRLADVLAEVALIAAEPFDVAELMQLASDRACEVFACDGAMVLLSLDGESLDPASASAGVTYADELFALDGGTPCHEVLASGEPALFQAEVQPPAEGGFASVAARLGIRGVLAVPLRHRDKVIGALSLLQRAEQAFPDTAVDDAQRLADVIAAGLVREQAHREAVVVRAQLEHALATRVIVEQAKGLVAGELRVTVEEALDRLRRFARARQLRLVEVATDVVNRDLPTEALR